MHRQTREARDVAEENDIVVTAVCQMGTDTHIYRERERERGRQGGRQGARKKERERLTQRDVEEKTSFVFKLDFMDENDDFNDALPKLHNEFS
jgi:hypothetical protein